VRGSYQLIESGFEESNQSDVITIFTSYTKKNYQVVYAGIHNREDCLERLKELAAALREQCESAGLTFGDDGPFTPHLTLMKLSRDPTLRRKGVKAINPQWYQEHKEISFGKQLASSIQLLSMEDPKDKSGYYASRAELVFNMDGGEMSGKAAALTSELREYNQLLMQKLISSAITQQEADFASCPGKSVIL